MDMRTNPGGRLRKPSYAKDDAVRLSCSPMKRDAVLEQLKGAEPALRKQGVAHAALFGSLARGDDEAGSDIDIMVEISPEARVDLFRYVGIVQLIDSLFPTHVDVVDRAALKAFVRSGAERDAIYAF